MECPLKDSEGCSEGKCAWWDDGSKVCAVKGIYDSLYNIDKSLETKNEEEVKSDNGSSVL